VLHQEDYFCAVRKGKLKIARNTYVCNWSSASDAAVLDTCVIFYIRFFLRK
jgi:hypothetical protein